MLKVHFPRAGRNLCDCNCRVFRDDDDPDASVGVVVSSWWGWHPGWHYGWRGCCWGPRVVFGVVPPPVVYAPPLFPVGFGSRRTGMAPTGSPGHWA